jgi:hypothetical protein
MSQMLPGVAWKANNEEVESRNTEQGLAAQVP